MGVIHKNSRLIKKSGYSHIDPTAYNAIGKVFNEDHTRIEEEDRFYNLLDDIERIVDLAGFEIEDRIVLKDKKTGRIWK